MAFNFQQRPLLVQEDEQPFRADALPRQLSFSPDGLMLLAGSDNGRVLAFHLPRHSFVDFNGRVAGDVDENLQPFSSCSSVSEAEALRDVTWHPKMSSAEPTTGLFLTAAKSNPLHLWGLDGKLMGNYSTTNQSDEIIGAYSCAFSPDGGTILAGYDRMLAKWDVTRPGKEKGCYFTSATRASKEGQRGIISTLAFNPAVCTNFAAGSFEGSIYCYDLRSWKRTGVFSDDGDGEVVGYTHLLASYSSGHSSAKSGSDDGNRRKRRRIEEEELAANSTSSAAAPSSARSHAAVTQVAFTPDGRYLCAGHRRSNDLLVWDVRKADTPLSRLQRDASSNQRLQFGVDGYGRHLVTGSRDGCVIVYDLLTGECVRALDGFSDAVASIALHPSGIVFATAVGQRHPDERSFQDSESDSDDEGSNSSRDSRDNSSSSAAAEATSRAPRRNTISIWRTVMPTGADDDVDEGAPASSEDAPNPR